MPPQFWTSGFVLALFFFAIFSISGNDLFMWVTSQRPVLEQLEIPMTSRNRFPVVVNMWDFFT